MAGTKTKPRKLAGLFEELEERTVAQLDEELAKVGNRWTLLYNYRQMRAKAEGITTAPPTLSKSETEAEPSRAENVNRQEHKARAFDGTLLDLIRVYETDPRSQYHNLRHATRQNYDSLLKRLREDCASEVVADLKAPDVQRFYDDWVTGGKFNMAHGLITMLRTLITFGALVLKDDDCERLSFALHRMKFTIPKTRLAGHASDGGLTAENVEAIRVIAHKKGRHSIALAQAIQFHCKLRQKDVIGELVPLDWPESGLRVGAKKWLRGIRWEQIDTDMILKHTTSREGKLIEIDLKEYPIVMEELERLKPLPSVGPVIINENTGEPWTPVQFRWVWREIARKAGVPEGVKNRQSAFGEAAEPRADADENSKKDRPADAGEHHPGRTLN